MEGYSGVVIVDKTMDATRRARYGGAVKRDGGMNVARCIGTLYQGQTRRLQWEGRRWRLCCTAIFRDARSCCTWLAKEAFVRIPQQRPLGGRRHGVCVKKTEGWGYNPVTGVGGKGVMA